jgi:hypothetical protein
MPTILFEAEPSGFALDPETNIVSWVRRDINDGQREAMHYPLFCKTIFACLAFIEQTNESRERAARAARAEARGSVICLRQHVQGGVSAES